ncbi:ATP-binding protein [Streptomyces sp. NPDC059166]|uniref:ATP-binding protein n=1 Tax=Streptomyces sp. NPDC059166 TaxID=3346752 RepID=UPI0036CE098E
MHPFERFRRGAPVRRPPCGGASAGGPGLGLAVASTIAETHQGRLELDTGPGEGCVFRLLLPDRTG